MRAKSIQGRSPGEIQSALQESIADGFQPALAIVFISVKLDRKGVCQVFSREGIDIIGATSCGEFIDGRQEEGSAAVLLLELSPESYTILFSAIGDKSLEEAATQLAGAAMQKFKRPAFILCSTSLTSSGEILDGEMLVRSIEKVAGPQVNIFGGMAGDDYTMTGTYVFTAGEETDTGMVALVLDEDKISLHGTAISGWKPIGLSRTVTKSAGSRIYTIDEQPAIEMYLKYLGKESLPGEDKYRIFENIGIHYPFQVERESGEPVMRTPMSFDSEENALVCDFAVPQGSTLRFSMPPDFDIVEKVLEDANEIKNTNAAEAEALLIFSCAGRLSALGPMAQSENEGLSDIWKVPMAGFYTYGEYGRAINGRQEFHSTTCCWVALKEK